MNFRDPQRAFERESLSSDGRIAFAEEDRNA
jgi:hypothetical protein